MNFAHLFCEFWSFSSGKQARFTYRTFVPECPREKLMNWPFLVWFAGATPELRPRDSCKCQARKRHININFFVRLVLGQTRVFSLFYTVEARFHRVFVPGTTQFVPGTNPETKGGTESLCEKKVYAPFSSRYLVNGSSGRKDVTLGGLSQGQWLVVWRTQVPPADPKANFQAVLRRPRLHSCIYHPSNF